MWERNKEKDIDELVRGPRSCRPLSIRSSTELRSKKHWTDAPTPWMQMSGFVAFKHECATTWVGWTWVWDGMIGMQFRDVHDSRRLHCRVKNSS